MIFKSYTEIENSYNEKVIEQIRTHGFDNPDIEWVATLKIDGSNMQFGIDENDNFFAGSRTRLLTGNEDFHGYERAMEMQEIESKLHLMKNWLYENHHLVKNTQFTLRVYGELCGGMYKHDSVEKVKGAVKIQGRVSYHPDNVWIPFDIELVDKDNTVIYIFPQKSASAICHMFNLPFTLILAHGTFDEMLDYPNDFIDETGHILFGIPKIEDNITEGVVLKPEIPLRFGNGARVMIKNKNTKFKERVKKTPKEPKEIIPMNELELKYFEIYREYITESRFMSVLSKLEKIDNKAFGIIMGKFLEDLYNDFNKEFAEEINQLESKYNKDEFNLVKIKKEIAKEISTFIRPLFVKIINSLEG